MKILIAIASLLALSGCVTTQRVPYWDYRTHRQPYVYYNDYRQPICYWRSTLHGVVRVCQ